MGKNNVLKKVEFYYALLWIFPIFFILKDFFNTKSLILIWDLRTLRILSFTLLQSILSSLLSLIISLLPSYYVSRKRNILSNVIENSLFIPFFFPPISAIIAFSILYSGNGLLSKIGINLNVMYNLKAILIAHTFYNSPIFIKYISEALKKIPQNIEETVNIEGANKLQKFFKIDLPIIMPSITRGFFLVFTYCFTSFAIVLSLGGIKYSTFEVAISTTLRGSMNFSKALTYAMIQFIVLTIINIFLSKTEEYQIEYQDFKIKKTNIFLFIFSLMYIIFEYSIVIVGILASIYNFYESKFDISGILNLFSKKINSKYHIIESIINSLSLSFITSIITVLFSYYILKKYSKFTNILITSTIGISSAFLAMGLVYLNILFSINYFYLLTIGYFLITVPICISFMHSHFLSFDRTIEEAAKLDGANKLQLLYYIDFPLMFPILLSSFLQIFTIIFGEFTIAYTMQINNSYPLVSLVNYTLSSSRLYKESSALSSLNILIIFFIFYISKIFSKKTKDDFK
ncbi:ABC transporter permease [Tepiditoga spiralis]|nr:ABC transporter permease subunit [Tepiditoga spiralis]